MDNFSREYHLTSVQAQVAELIGQLAEEKALINLGSALNFRLVTCLAELLNNIVLHAHASDESKKIVLRLDIDARRIDVKAWDQGSPFELDSVPAACDIASYGGRGLDILRTWSTSYRVHSSAMGNTHHLVLVRMPTLSG